LFFWTLSSSKYYQIKLYHFGSWNLLPSSGKKEGQRNLSVGPLGPNEAQQTGFPALPFLPDDGSRFPLGPQGAQQLGFSALSFYLPAHCYHAIIVAGLGFLSCARIGILPYLHKICSRCVCDKIVHLWNFIMVVEAWNFERYD
jgi:hypothetical protein